MKIEFVNVKDYLIAEVKSDAVVINTLQDALDLMGDCYFQGARGIIIEEKNIIPNFFDLKTGIAGEILQKFSTYDIRLSIVGDFSKYTSKSLRDFIYESNKMGRITFVTSFEEAKKRLSE
jgi:hypothetical protein